MASLPGRRRLLLSLSVPLVGAVAACSGEPPAPAPLPDVAEVALDRAGEGTIEGTLDGAPFVAGDVRVRIVTRAGRERVDLLVADRPIERCGLPIAREETLVWARFPGATELAPGTFERLAEPAPASGAHGATDDAEDEGAAAGDGVEATGDGAPPSTFEVHYERPTADGLRAVHRGLGRIEITRRLEDGRLEGRLRICFADAGHSCVGGSFVAAPCLSRIDGRALREPPGLADEALEPRRGGRP